jgi:drug/metabolite transporter (DMT)-like permease
MLANNDQLTSIHQNQTMKRTLDSKQITLYAILLSVVLNASGQLLFKAARFAQPDASMLALFLRVETWAGFVTYGLSSIAWLWVLSRAQLSYAYPTLALTFPVVVGLSAVLFAESISMMRLLGVTMIIIGVATLARS